MKETEQKIKELRAKAKKKAHSWSMVILTITVFLTLKYMGSYLNVIIITLGLGFLLDRIFFILLFKFYKRKL
jgi:hypothetical protein